MILSIPLHELTGNTAHDFSSSNVLILSSFADNQLTAGQFIQCCIKSIDKARAVLYVDSDPDVIAKRVVCFSSFICLCF